MIRIGNGMATTVATVPVMGCEAHAVLALEFDQAGRLRGYGVKATPPPRENADERAARELAEAIGQRLRRIGSVHEALNRARVAVEFLENLAALEALHARDARALLAPEAGA